MPGGCEGEGDSTCTLRGPGPRWGRSPVGMYLVRVHVRYTDMDGFEWRAVGLRGEQAAAARRRMSFKARV